MAACGSLLISMPIMSIFSLSFSEAFAAKLFCGTRWTYEVATESLFPSLRNSSLSKLVSDWKRVYIADLLCFFWPNSNMFGLVKFFFIALIFLFVGGKLSTFYAASVLLPSLLVVSDVVCILAGAWPVVPSDFASSFCCFRVALSSSTSSVSLATKVLLFSYTVAFFGDRALFLRREEDLFKIS